jgi:hypothetical protein
MLYKALLQALMELGDSQMLNPLYQMYRIASFQDELEGFVYWEVAKTHFQCSHLGGDNRYKIESYRQVYWR